MKRIFFIFLLLLLIIAGAYSVLWHQQADKVVATTQRWVDSVNNLAKARGLPAEQAAVKITSIESSGFPFAMRITLTDPVLQWQPAAEEAPDWRIEQALNGSITFGGELLAQQLTMQMDGVINGKHYVAKQQVAPFRVTPQGQLACSITIDAPQAIQHATKRLVEWLRLIQEKPELIRAGNCQLPAIVADDTADAILLQAQPFSANITQQPYGADQRRINVDYQLEALRYSEAFSAQMQQLAQSLTAAGYAELATMLPLNWHLFGTQQAKFKGRYDGAIPFRMPQAEENLSIIIDEMTLNSDLFASQFNGNLTSKVELGQRNTDISWKSVQDYRAGYMAFVDAYLADIAQLQNTPDSTALDTSLLPDMELLSPIRSSANIRLETIDGQKALQAKAVIEGLTLSTKLWQLAISGRGKTGSLLPVPEGELRIACKNCPTFLKRLGDYILQLNNSQTPQMDALVQNNMVTSSAAAMTTERWNASSNLLKAIAQANAETTPTDYRYDIKNQMFQPTVNGLDTNAMSKLRTQILVPVLKQSTTGGAPSRYEAEKR